MNKKSAAIILIIIIVVVTFGGAAYYFFVVPKPNPYDVALITGTGGLGDKSFNDAAERGLVAAAAEYGITYVIAEPTSDAEYEPLHRHFASHPEWIEPYKVIIGVGYDQADAIMAAAADYPAQPWAIVDMFIDPGTYPNVTSLLFSEEQGSALVGALAGLTTTTDKIGFVGGQNIDLIRKFAAGYYWGANMTNPNIHLTNATGSVNITTSFVGTDYTAWTNIAAAKTLADGMYATGLDIIFAAAGRAGIGVINSAKENNASYVYPIWAIGVDSPQMYMGCADPDNPAPPTAVLTSMVKRVDLAVKWIIGQVVGGSYAGGTLSFWTLANGGVEMEINTTLLTLPAAHLNTVNMIKTGIINGTFTVPVTYTFLEP